MGLKEIFHIKQGASIETSQKLPDDVTGTVAEYFTVLNQLVAVSGGADNISAEGLDALKEQARDLVPGSGQALAKWKGRYELAEGEAKSEVN